MTATNGANTATVETLVAEVRVLMVGSRQITLSVAKQLDRVHPDELEAFGRINTGDQEGIEVIGRSVKTGALVTSWALHPNSFGSDVSVERYIELHELPLIVLAGLR